MHSANPRDFRRREGKDTSHGGLRSAASHQHRHDLALFSGLLLASCWARNKNTNCFPSSMYASRPISRIGRHWPPPPPPPPPIPLLPLLQRRSQKGGSNRKPPSRSTNISLTAEASYIILKEVQWRERERRNIRKRRRSFDQTRWRGKKKKRLENANSSPTVEGVAYE